MSQVKALILTGNGFNTQENVAIGFTLCGAIAEQIPLQKFLQNPQILLQYHILGIPGGFSYGDRISSGRIVAHLLRKRAGGVLNQFITQKGIILGICNGFQILIKMGLLPHSQDNQQEGTLTFNKNFCYENKWIDLECNPQSPCIWTKQITTLQLPYLARESRLLIPNPVIQHQVIQHHWNAISYQTKKNINCSNGSFHNIAGLCDASGQILGLMPHPEFLLSEHHFWDWKARPREKTSTTTGLSLFHNGVNFAKQWLS